VNFFGEGKKIFVDVLSKKLWAGKFEMTVCQYLVTSREIFLVTSREYFLVTSREIILVTSRQLFLEFTLGEGQCSQIME